MSSPFEDASADDAALAAAREPDAPPTPPGSGSGDDVATELKPEAAGSRPTALPSPARSGDGLTSLPSFGVRVTVRTPDVTGHVMNLSDSDGGEEDEAPWNRHLGAETASGAGSQLCPGCTCKVLLLSVVIAVIAAFLVTLLLDTGTPDPVPINELENHPFTASGANGVVSATNYMAAKAGRDMLERGGNAVDAAAVVQFMLNVVQPESTGIGGGCLPMIYMRHAHRVHALDGREEAPAAFSDDAFCRYANCSEAWPFWPERVTGGHSVGVPGTLAATAYALEHFGTITLAEALQPAIKAAHDGVPMTEHLHSRIASSADRLRMFPASWALFLNEAGTAPKVAAGQNWTNPELAATFELIAREGPGVLYGGELGQDIVSAVQGARNPTTGKAGLMTLSDLAGYRAVERQPLKIPYNDHFVYAHAPPDSGGLTTALVLNQLTGMDMEGMEANDLAAIHAFVDSINIAWADRARYMGDADFFDVPRAGLTNATYAQARRDLLMKIVGAVDVPVPAGVPGVSTLAQRRRLEQAGADQAGPAPGPGPARRTSAGPAPPFSTPRNTWYTPFGDDGYGYKSGTTHFSIIDKDRNVVSWTTTVEENLGSGVVVPNRGFVLNNELTDFDPLPRYPDTGELAANRPEGGKKLRRTALGADAMTLGGKRPMSSMNPMIVLDDRGRPALALGSPGGSTIISTTIGVLLNVIDHEMSLRQATDLPRTVTRNGDYLIMEQELFMDYKLQKKLAAAGYKVTSKWGNRPLGFVQSARVLYARNLDVTGTLEAAADKRLDSAGAYGF